MSLRGIVLIAFFSLSLPVCLFRPFYGIMLWIVVAFLNPQSYTWGAFDAFPWASAVAIPTILGMLVFDNKFVRLASRLFGMLVVLWVWFTITTIISTHTPELAHHASETFYKWKFVSKILVMTTCTILIVSSFERLRYLVLTIAGCFGAYVLKSFPFIIATGGAFRLFGPERSMVADNNDFGLALNMTLPLFFFLVFTERNKWSKRFAAFLFIITIPAIFFTYSRGAMVGLAALLLAILLNSRRRFALLPIIVLAAVIAVFFAPQEWQDRMNPGRQDALDPSALARLHAWEYARNLVADYPIVGGGFDTFTWQLYERYAPPELDYVFGPHSVYFQVLAEHGYVGLFLYLVLVLSCFVATWRLRRAARSRGDDEVEHYAQMFQFSLVGFLTSGIFLGRAYFDYYFTIVACIIILDRVARDRWAANVRLAAAPALAEPATAGLFVPRPPEAPRAAMARHE